MSIAESFAIGQLIFSIRGKDYLVNMISSFLKNYQHASPFNEGVLVHIEEGAALCCEDGLPDGWTSKRKDGNDYVSYSVHGRVIFALQYNNAKIDEVVVRVRRPLNRYVLLGAQYGLMLALAPKCIGLHGVTLLCKHEIIILSAPSGTGKTTLSRLLVKHCDALVINGDFALLSVSADGVIFEPTPFCGSSRRCLKHRVRIDRIVFLEQSLFNYWQALTGRESMIRFLDNSFVPSWDRKLESAVKKNIIQCISEVKIDAFFFAPEKGAAEEFYKHLQ